MAAGGSVKRIHKGSLAYRLLSRMAEFTGSVSFDKVRELVDELGLSPANRCEVLRGLRDRGLIQPIRTYQVTEEGRRLLAEAERRGKQ